MTWGDAKLVGGGKAWEITCKPHVMTRLKQVFSKANKMQFGTVQLSASDENCRDLQWFCQRFPLEISDPHELEERARRYDARQATTTAILQGEYELPDLRMALPPREYQAQAAALTLANGSLLLADELGLGKTVTAIAMLAGGLPDQTFPALVVCPTHLTAQWQRELERFLPGINVHVGKKGQAYDLDPQPDVLILSYTKLRGWAEELAGHVRAVIFDECQDLRTGQGSYKYEAASHIAAQAHFRMGLSATPIYNYGSEFWNVLDVLKPGALGSRDEFLREWCHGSYGDRKWRISDPEAFGTFLRETGMMLRRTRADVDRELPSLTRVVQEVESNRERLRDVERGALDLARIILSQGGSNFEKMQAGSEFSNRLRQATGLAKAPYVADFVKMLIDTDDEPVVLFGWHRAVYDVWVQLLHYYDPAMFTGSESPTQKAKSIDRFLSGDTPLLIMSLRSGSGVDGLQKACSRVVVGELDWSPGALEQCIGRVHRDGQAHPVFAYFLTALEGADPIMVDVLDLKTEQIEGVRDPGADPVIQRQIDPDHVKRLAEDYLHRYGRRS